MGKVGVEILGGNVASDGRRAGKWRNLGLIHACENKGIMDEELDSCVDAQVAPQKTKRSAHL
jgi:hypothetical protein